jgi:hypothetical protein
MKQNSIHEKVHSIDDVDVNTYYLVIFVFSPVATHKNIYKDKWQINNFISIGQDGIMQVGPAFVQLLQIYLHT